MTILEDLTKKLYITVSDNSKLRVQLVNPDDRHRYNILIVPGFNSYILAWEILIEKLLKHFNVYFLETREKDTAIVETNDFSFKRYSQDIIEVWEELNFSEDNSVIIGSSIASSIIFKIVAEEALKPHHAFLVSPLPYIPYPKISMWYSEVMPPWFHRIVTKNLIRAFLFLFVWPDRLQYKYYAHGVKRINWDKFYYLIREFRRFTILDVEYSENASPIVIVGARKDRGHPIKHIKLLKERFPRVELVEVKYNSDSVGLGLWNAIKEKLNLTEEVSIIDQKHIR